MKGFFRISLTDFTGLSKSASGLSMAEKMLVKMRMFNEVKKINCFKLVLILSHKKIKIER